MDTPRTPRDNLRTSPGLDDLEEVGSLEAPLLPHAEPPDSSPGAGGGTGRTSSLPAVVETKWILGMGVPMVVEEVLAYLSTIISVAFAGRLGGYSLGVFTLSHALTNITGIALLNGVTGAVDTFASQAHGSRTFPAIGVVLQRALLLALLTCLLLMLLYWQALPVLLLLGQEGALAADAARYTRIFAAKIPLHAVALCLYRTLAAQGAAAHVLAASAAYCGVTAPINWALISWLDWGLDGSAAAAVACEAVHNAQQPPGQRWWRGWSRDALRDWAPFAKLSVSSTLMIVLDWWAYDILTFLAGLLAQPDIPVAATGIVYNVQTIVFMLPLGLSFAVCARVGHHLGAAQPHSAKLAAEVGTGMGIAATGLPALLLILLGSRTAALFTADAAVARACAPLIPPLATVMLTNSATALLGGILRGSGRQKLGAVVNGALNYSVGLPLQLLFAFKLGGGVAGLWWGIAIAAALQALVLAVLVSRFDWQREAGRAAKLVRHLSQTGMSGGCAMAGRDRQLSLLDLPDELLGLVLSHARSDCLDGDGNLLLTYKRFLRVYMSERDLWRKVAWSFPRLTRDQGQLGPLPRSFAEQDRYLFSKLRLLQHVAGMVEDFEIGVSPLLLDQSAAGGDSEWRADEFLAHLQPGALRALSIQCEPSVPGSLVRAAERFTRLTALRICTDGAAPAATPAVLRRLTLSQHFQLRSDLSCSRAALEQLPKGIIPALLALQQLTGLQLKGQSPDGGDF